MAAALEDEAGDGATRTLGLELSGDPPAPAPRVMGTTIGRYLVLDTIGAGGMGVVHRAYDAQLRREVALKVLAPHRAGTEERARVFREAQSLAQLSHPNVVQVYEVGAHEDNLFLAMELVIGETLGDWLEDRRGWRDVLRVMGQAGQGLAAAHAARLIHRDFKPANVLVGRDGRVRVADFGLARGTDDAGPASSSGSLHDSHDSELSLSSPLTRADVVMGTPPYMAPEQFLGVVADARADQYAFCVTLFEALTGVRPFVRDAERRNWVELKRGPVVWPRKLDAPRWVRRVVERGLAWAPEQRWPTMEALLAALADDPTRKRWAVAALLVVAVAGISAVSWSQLERRRALARCDDAGASIALVWDPAATQRVRDAVLATGVGYAEDTLGRVIGRLDAYAQAWSELRTATCVAGEVEHTQAAESIVQTDECFAERRAELAALVEALATADAGVVQRATVAAARLPAVALCGDAQWLARRSPTPDDPERRRAVAELRVQLASVRRMEYAAQDDAARREIERISAEAAALDWPPLQAETLLALGRVDQRGGNYDLARLELIQAMTLAARTGADFVEAEAVGQLAYVVGYRLARHEDGLVWAGLAESLFERLGEGEGPTAASLTSNIGSIQYLRGDFAESLRQHTRALEQQERVLGADHPDVSSTLNNIGNVYRALEQFEQAVASYERALEIRETVLGPDHPDVAATLNNLGTVFLARGDHAMAADYFRRAVDIKERALGRDHPDVAGSLNNLGGAEYSVGAYDDALVHFERALLIMERVHGPQHPTLAGPVNNLGLIHYDRGEYEQAIVYLRRALEVQRAALGPEHLDLAAVHENIGLAHHALGAHAEALADHRAALAIREKALGPEHRDVAKSLATVGQELTALDRPDEAIGYHERALAIAERIGDEAGPELLLALVGIGEARLAQGRIAEARVALERAFAASEANAGDRETNAGIRFALARALVDNPATRARAVALAEAARGVLRATPGPSDTTALDAWLRRHR